MSVAIWAGRLLPIGEVVYYDSTGDLRGVIIRKSDKRFEVQWDGGNAVWYPFFHMFYTKIPHQRKAS